MQYVVVKSITFESLAKETRIIPAGVTIVMCPERMIGYFAGFHFDVKPFEVRAIC